jgi:integrative and conjugative element protein (TIGR02256 family)
MPSQRVETVRLPLRLSAEIGAEAIGALPRETGGILLGRWSGATAEVISIVGAGPSAAHERTSFDPDQRWQVAEVARRYADRPDASEYLGDWHSHPYGRAKPSMTDWWVAARISKYREARNSKPLMMICAVTEKGLAEVAVFQFRGLRLRDIRLQVE